MPSDEELKSKIKEFWAKSNDWDEYPTSIEGLSIVKYPIKQANQIFVGLKIKKSKNSYKGIYLKSSKELNAICSLLKSPEMEYIINQISKDSPERKKISSLKEWDTFDSSIPGLFYTKMPIAGNEGGFPAIALNPVDEFGRKTRRRNIYIKNLNDLKTYFRLFNNEKIDRLISIIEEVNSELTVEFKVAQWKIRGQYS